MARRLALVALLVTSVSTSARDREGRRALHRADGDLGDPGLVKNAMGAPLSGMRSSCSRPTASP